MSTAQDKFSALETRIMETIELVKKTRQEKQIAEKEMFAARSEVARLERELEQLRRERDVVKNRVESLVEMLSELGEESLVSGESKNDRS
jgi:chromosome segregation ATPase